MTNPAWYVNPTSAEPVWFERVGKAFDANRPDAALVRIRRGLQEFTVLADDASDLVRLLNEGRESGGPANDS